MAGDVFSYRFLAGTIGGSGATAVLPAGYAYVVRDIEVFGSTSEVPYQGTVAIDGIGPFFAWYMVEGEASSPPWRQWQGRVFMNAGETLRVEVTALQVVNVCGYQLRLP